MYSLEFESWTWWLPRLAFAMAYLMGIFFLLLLPCLFSSLMVACSDSSPSLDRETLCSLAVLPHEAIAVPSLAVPHRHDNNLVFNSIATNSYTTVGLASRCHIHTSSILNYNSFNLLKSKFDHSSYLI